jgi:RNA polymerase sigma-70 factor, ECF subfamily
MDTAAAAGADWVERADVTPERDPDALRRLLPFVYEELRGLARYHRWRLHDRHSPGTTSLVHEAYLKLEGGSRVAIRSRGEFFALASRVVRSVLIDNARRHQRRKREGDARPVPVNEALLPSEERSDELVALDEALTRLHGCDPRLARIVECRFFGGLTVEETAEALGLSPATVKRGWDAARARLYAELRPGA